ncbi:MAG: putative peptidoglycan binding domain-containing protein [Candidatus Sulfotelmatobacter sp.]
MKYASSRKNGKRKPRGQQKIDSERAEAIQGALIREHYMTGQPTGTWNQASEDAMRRYQADHGWQSKEVPDSRALISLGLGPSNDHLLNPESAMTSAPNISHAATPVSSTSQSPVSHGADPGPRMSPTQVPSSESLPATPDHDAPSPQ